MARARSSYMKPLEQARLRRVTFRPPVDTCGDGA